MKAWILPRTMCVHTPPCAQRCTKRSPASVFSFAFGCGATCADFLALLAVQVTLQYLKSKRMLGTYGFFVFLNSSVRGPFYPSYMPSHWQWTDAFTQRLDADTKILSSSLVCLPAVDAGSLGPKVINWHSLHSAGSLGHLKFTLSVAYRG